MAKSKKRFVTKQVEKNDTAAWANICRIKPGSRVTMPSQRDVLEAKEYVDANQM